MSPSIRTTATTAGGAVGPWQLVRGLEKKIVTLQGGAKPGTQALYMCWPIRGRRGTLRLGIQG